MEVCGWSLKLRSGDGCLGGGQRRFRRREGLGGSACPLEVGCENTPAILFILGTSFAEGSNSP